MITLNHITSAWARGDDDSGRRLQTRIHPSRAETLSIGQRLSHEQWARLQDPAHGAQRKTPAPPKP